MTPANRQGEAAPGVDGNADVVTDKAAAAGERKLAFRLARWVVGIWAAAGLLTWFLIGKPKGSGEFGDMFGAVNALFSGLAFGGVIFTIWLQREELKLQREELRLTREEIKRSREEQERQTQIFAEQFQFEKKRHLPVFGWRSRSFDDYNRAAGFRFVNTGATLWNLAVEGPTEATVQLIKTTLVNNEEGHVSFLWPKGSAIPNEFRFRCSCVAASNEMVEQRFLVKRDELPVLI